MCVWKKKMFHMCALILNISNTETWLNGTKQIPYNATTKLKLTIWHRIKSSSSSIKITRKNTSTTPNYELFLAKCSTVTAHNRGTTILFKMGKCNLSAKNPQKKKEYNPYLWGMLGSLAKDLVNFLRNMDKNEGLYSWRNIFTSKYKRSKTI